MWFAVAMAVVSLAMSAYAMMNMPKFNQDDSGVELADAGAAQEINFVYGRSRVQCNKIFEDVAPQGNANATEGDWLSIVAVAGQGPFNSLKQIYLNGTPVLKPQWQNAMQTENATSGIIGKGYIEDRFASHIQIQFNMGQKDYFYSMINQMHPNKWDNTCVGKGIASVALKILRDPYKGEIQASPTIEVEVEGRLVRDVRMTSTEPAYRATTGVPGTNPALCILDYLVHPNGVGISWDDIDEYSFAQLAGYFDKFNYRCNGVLNQGQSIKSNLEALQADFQCVVTKPMNKWRLISWTPDVVDVEFTEDDILEKDIEISWGSSKLAFNRLEVEYQDANKEFQKDILSYPACTNDELIAKDGNVTVKKIEAKFTTSKEQVDRFASVFYESNRSLCVVKFKGNEKAYNSQVGDIVMLTHSKFQLNKKLFKVAAIKRSTTVEETAVAEITLAEYTPSAFDVTHTSGTGGAVVMPPEVIDKPHNLRFTVAEVGDTFTGCLRWDRAQCYDFLEYVVEYKLSSQPDSEWQHYGRTQNNEMYLFNLHGAFYDFRVFTRTRYMKTSDFEYLFKVDVQDDTILPQVTGLKLVTTNKDKGITDTKDFAIVWDSMDAVEVKPDLQMLPNATGYQTVATVKKGYEVEIFHGTEFKRTVFTTEPNYIYQFDLNQMDGTSRYVTFKVRILSKGGSKSREPAVLAAKNRQCLEPTGIAPTADNAGIQLTWDPCIELDFKGTNVYVSKTKGFTPTDKDIPKDIVVTATHFFMPSLDGKWYVRIAHFDVFGTDELVYSKEYELNPQSAFSQMQDLQEGLTKEFNDALKSTDAKLTKEAEETKKEMNAALKSVDDKLVQEIGDRKAAITKVEGVVDANDKKAVKSINDLRVEMQTADKNLQANINQTNSAYAAADKAMAEQINTVSAKLNDTSATVTQHSSAIASINGTLRAEHYMKVQADGKYAGIGLIADSGTKSSQIIFAAEQMLFVDPASKTNKPIMEIRNGKVMMVNAMIDDLSSDQIRAGAITADKIAANAITSNHITANVQIRTPDLLMDSIRLNNGAGAFGKGNGPYDAWGEKWGTVIYSNGKLCTNNVQATGGNIKNMTIGNCVIEEDCTVKGWLYADKIIGMPTVKLFGLGETGLPVNGNWMTVAKHTINSPQGRFDTLAMLSMEGDAVGAGFYGVKNMESARGYNWIGVRVLHNGKELNRWIVNSTPQGDHEFHMSHFSWYSGVMNVGAYGGELIVQFSTVGGFTSGPGRPLNVDWNTGVMYTNRGYNVLVSNINGSIYCALNA